MRMLRGYRLGEKTLFVSYVMGILETNRSCNAVFFAISLRHDRNILHAKFSARSVIQRCFLWENSEFSKIGFIFRF